MPHLVARMDLCSSLPCPQPMLHMPHACMPSVPLHRRARQRGVGQCEASGPQQGADACATGASVQRLAYAGSVYMVDGREVWRSTPAVACRQELAGQRATACSAPSRCGAVRQGGEMLPFTPPTARVSERPSTPPLHARTWACQQRTWLQRHTCLHACMHPCAAVRA